MPYLQLASLKLKLLRFIRYTYPILPCSVYIFSVGKCSSLSNLTSIKYCLNNHSLCLERLIYNWIQKLLAIARFYQSVTSWLLLSEVLFFPISFYEVKPVEYNASWTLVIPFSTLCAKFTLVSLWGGLSGEGVLLVLHWEWSCFFFWHKCQNLMQCTLKILLAVTSVVIMITICSIFCSDYNTSTTSLTCLISLFHVNL